MTPSSNLGDLAHIIQLSVAPVFLLVAIGSMLGVVTGRLGRVIDRARVLEQFASDTTCPIERTRLYKKELRALDKRMSFCHWSINFCAIAALLIALLVAVLFVSDLVNINAELPVGLLFTTAMTCIILGLCFFLAEIYLATKTVRVRSELLADEMQASATQSDIASSAIG